MRSLAPKRFETPEFNISVQKLGSFKLPSIGFPRLGRNVEANVFERLAAVIETIEAMIEDMRRLYAYRSEIQAIQNLGMSFHQWQQLTPPTGSPGEKPAPDVYYSSQAARPNGIDMNCRGWTKVATHSGTIAESRRFKPELPEIGREGVPIRDEIEGEIQLCPEGA